MLTRGVDEFIPLRARVARARAWDADLFLSIHADALPDAAMRGLSVFTLSAQASDREAAALAVSENKADLVGGITLLRQSREDDNVWVAITDGSESSTNPSRLEIFSADSKPTFAPTKTRCAR